MRSQLDGAARDALVPPDAVVFKFLRNGGTVGHSESGALCTGNRRCRRRYFQISEEEGFAGGRQLSSAPRAVTFTVRIVRM
jgi:hypothetical protein